MVLIHNNFLTLFFIFLKNKMDIINYIPKDIIYCVVITIICMIAITLWIGFKKKVNEVKKNVEEEEPIEKDLKKTRCGSSFKLKNIEAMLEK